MGKSIEGILLKTSTNGQYIHEEMFNILSHEGNANQNNIEISICPPVRMAIIKEQTRNVGECVRKNSTSTLLVGT
jgi:hypothetical protein